MIKIKGVKAEVKGVSVNKLAFKTQYIGCVYEDEHNSRFSQIDMYRISHTIHNVRVFDDTNIIFDVNVLDSPHGKILQEILDVGIVLEFIPLVSENAIYGIQCKPLFKNLKQTRLEKLKKIFKNDLFANENS